MWPPEKLWLELNFLINFNVHKGEKLVWAFKRNECVKYWTLYSPCCGKAHKKAKRRKKKYYKEDQWDVKQQKNVHFSSKRLDILYAESFSFHLLLERMKSKSSHQDTGRLHPLQHEEARQDQQHFPGRCGAKRKSSAAFGFSLSLFFTLASIK